PATLDEGGDQTAVQVGVLGTHVEADPTVDVGRVEEQQPSGSLFVKFRAEPSEATYEVVPGRSYSESLSTTKSRKRRGVWPPPPIRRSRHSRVRSIAEESLRPRPASTGGVGRVRGLCLRGTHVRGRPEMRRRLKPSGASSRSKAQYRISGRGPPLA